MPSPASTTSQHQSALARYCLTGRYEAIPGVREAHVTHYRELVYNIVDDILQSAYPLTYDLLLTEEWEELVDQFMSSHACQSPQVWQMPKELYEFVRQEEHPLLRKYPFLTELLCFEWLEVELFMAEDKTVDYASTGDTATDPLVLNPEYDLQHFHYPVHRKNAKDITEQDKGNYYVVLFRTPDSGNVQFMDLSPALVYLVEQLAEGPANIQELTNQVCEAFQIPVQQETVSGILQFVTRSLDNKLILGYNN